jgi:hypothetical protein
LHGRIGAEVADAGEIGPFGDLAILAFRRGGFGKGNVAANGEDFAVAVAQEIAFGSGRQASRSASALARASSFVVTSMPATLVRSVWAASMSNSSPRERRTLSSIAV